MNEEIDISEEPAAEAEGAGSEQITTAAEEPAQQTVSEESIHTGRTGCLQLP